MLVFTLYNYMKYERDILYSTLRTYSIRKHRFLQKYQVKLNKWGAKTNTFFSVKKKCNLDKHTGIDSTYKAVNLPNINNIFLVNGTNRFDTLSICVTGATICISKQTAFHCMALITPHISEEISILLFKI